MPFKMSKDEYFEWLSDHNLHVWLITELQHDKTNKMTCVLSELRWAWASAQSHQSSLCAQWEVKDPRFLHADSKDQTVWMPRLICLCWAHSHFVGFVMLRLIWFTVMIWSFWSDRSEQTMQTQISLTRVYTFAILSASFGYITVG